jgi:creatinine amidohydrolase
MPLASRFWSDLSSPDFARLAASPDIDRAVAVLPLAATEQHGPHLPTGVDATLADALVAASLPHIPGDLPVLFLPTQAIGKSDEHQRFPGTLTLSAETLIRAWTELGACVARSGLRKLVLFNSHGGNAGVMDIVAREIRSRHDIIVVHCSWFNLPLPAHVHDLFTADEHRFGIHGGDIETSMMLALRPERVDMGQARDFRSSSQDRAAMHPILGNGRSAKFGWQMQDYHPMGAAGDASRATADKGRMTIEAAGRALAQLLQEVASLPASTLVDSPDLPLA